MPVQSNTTNPNNSNNPALNEAQKQAHNLTGVNGSEFNLSPSFRERSNIVPPPAPDETSQDETYGVIALNRQEQYLHARIEAKNEANTVHAPKFVDKLILQLRKGDPSVHILPYDLGSFKSSDIIGHEKSLPTDSD